MLMAARRNGFGRWYHDAVSSSPVFEQFIRLCLLAFMVAFIWVGWTMVKESALNVYFDVMGSAESTQGKILESTGRSWRRIVSVHVSYQVDNDTYSVWCFQLQRTWDFLDPATGRIAIRYVTGVPAVGACRLATITSLILFISGVIVTAIGVFAVRTMVFYRKSNLYNKLLGIQAPKKTRKNV